MEVNVVDVLQASPQFRKERRGDDVNLSSNIQAKDGEMA